MSPPAPRIDSEFILPPPVPGNWAVLDAAQAGLVLARLEEARLPELEGAAVRGLRVLPLGFYPGWVLCDIRVAAQRAANGAEAADETVHSLLYGPDGFTPLDGTSGPIHLHNELHGLHLADEESQTAYLRFFCFFVRGPEGPFEICADTASLEFADADGVPGAAVIEPVVRADGAASGALAEYLATIVYAGMLARCRFALQAGGQVSMEDDTPLAHNVRSVPPLAFAGTGRYRA